LHVLHPHTFCSAYRFDYVATKTRSIIVPSCGLDSVPADIAPYIANRTLKDAKGPDACLADSMSAVRASVRMAGGTFATLTTLLTEVPAYITARAQQDYSLSPGISVFQP